MLLCLISPMFRLVSAVFVGASLSPHLLPSDSSVCFFDLLRPCGFCVASAPASCYFFSLGGVAYFFTVHVISSCCGCCFSGSFVLTIPHSNCFGCPCGRPCMALVGWFDLLFSAANHPNVLSIYIMTISSLISDP